MDILEEVNAYETIRVRLEDDICYLQIYRPEANNTINDDLVRECTQALEKCEKSMKILVLEGLPEVFCFGADFTELEQSAKGEPELERKSAEPLYDLWLRLATAPYITIAHVRGKVNAGGIGFVAACDIVLCERKAVFSLSELLFGLIPACVLPFLIRRMGFSRAQYMTVMTQPVSSQQAQVWGLVDAVEENSSDLLRKQLLRLRRLSGRGIARYKRYINSLNDILTVSKSKALEANREVFSDPGNIHNISRYVETGRFPWEAD